MAVSFQQRLGRFFVRLATILIVAGLLLFLPDPQNGEILRYKNAVVVFVAIVAIGKILYDTFFYDRFQS